jgi:hypothetical protein
MEEVKYLWLNDGDQSIQTIYIYLNEKGEEISGNIVSSGEFPYSPQSVYKSAKIVGIAAKYVGKIDNSIWKME